MKLRICRALIITAFVVLVFTSTSHAMHISEGILPFNWAVLWFAVAVPFVAYGIKRMKELSKEDMSFKPLIGLMAAIVFVISLGRPHGNLL